MTSLSYTTTTDYNALQAVRTHGSDVGYKNVTVKEKNNGRSEFEYRTPIDFPEEGYTTTYPFIPSINKDFNRGQVSRERIFNKDGDILSLTDFHYEVDSVVVVTGIRGNNVEKCIKASEYATYAEFKHCYINQCGIAGAGWFNCSPDYFLNYHSVYDSYGWSKLISKTKTDYSYNPGVQSITSQESFDYNPLNKKVASHVVTDALGDQFKTDYYYHTGNSIYSQNRVSEIYRIDSIKNSNLVSSSWITFGSAWGMNVSLLPRSIQVAKGNHPLEDRILFNRYDEFGNVLEVWQESGIVICYIWGYGKTVPVAKIENMSYINIPAGLITAIETASNTSVTGLETNLLTALANLRNDPALAGALVTGITYQPLVGAKTMTDPKGNRTTYDYDNFGRLSSVKDHEGKFLSQHSYNYRP